MKIFKLLRKSKGKWFFPLIGFLALIWFLIRVIPKPSRAAYPCMQATFPAASSFIVWLVSIFSSLALFKKARMQFSVSPLRAGLLFIAALLVYSVSFLEISTLQIFADNTGNAIDAIDAYTGGTPLVENKSVNRTKVSIIQSDKTYASAIGYNEIKQMLREAVTAEGTFDTLIKNNMTVILKPNLGSHNYKDSDDAMLPPEVNGMNTDYRVIQAAVDLIREKNPNGKIYILEGSGRIPTKATMEQLKYDEITGIDSLVYLEETSGSYLEYDSDELVKVSLPEDKCLYPDFENKYYLNKLYYEADVTISIPTLKIHGGPAVITGAVKNVAIGTAPSTIYGTEPNSLVRSRIDHSGDSGKNLHRFIHDFFMCRPVEYVIVDGLQAMQRGAHAFMRDTMNMRLLMAGADAVAVDAVSALIMCQDPGLIHHLVYLHNDEIGCADARYIDVTGNRSVSDVKKPFANWYKNAIYSDLQAPQIDIDTAWISNNELIIRTLPDYEMTKATIELNGKKTDTIYLAEFDEMRLKVDAEWINSEDNLLTIHAFDKYLNKKTVSYTIQKNIATKLSKGSKDKHLNFTIFPNPATETIRIECKNTQNKDIVLRIIDLQGNKLITKQYKHSASFFSCQLNIKNLPNANYILEIKTSNNSQRKMFTKK